uniref:Uncharacterized protein n=1 Tax=Nelumbo nucifera TaxID=4432 RepID=A0A822XFD6_NELNU|nr:TPA_asm: hypothetical protein HUJ06_020553 [Nelumbo nucifera]
MKRTLKALVMSIVKFVQFEAESLAFSEGSVNGQMAVVRDFGRLRSSRKNFWSSSFLKKFVVDVAHSFLRKNCRRTAMALNTPCITLIEVSMIHVDAKSNSGGPE